MSHQNNDVSADKFDIKVELLSSHIFFTQYFFELRYNRPFIISQPIGRESHHLTLSKELTKTFHGELTQSIIAVPPRYGKTEMIVNFIAWAMAWYPDSNFIYTSYSHKLASKYTGQIRSIIQHPAYRYFFGVKIEDDSFAKDNFETTAGGSVYGVGAGGSITGRGAGILDCSRYGGGIFVDDIIKPKDALSETIREERNEWFFDTLFSRKNDSKTPIVVNGQRTHEEDLQGKLMKDVDWKLCSLEALDAAGNALYPKMHDTAALLKLKELSPYVFASQYQQNPQPSGGGIFKEEWFKLFDEMPSIFYTIITVDTAETDKNWNDPTVFSFWGIYKVKHGALETDLPALHWLDCEEDWIEPCDLEERFMAFYYACMRFSVQPTTIIIENKNTGVTLRSALKKLQGFEVISIDRNKSSGSKSARFLDAQPYVSSGRVSLPRYGNHTKGCIEHCGKITANGSHRHDDRADTMFDAIDSALIKNLFNHNFNQIKEVDLSKQLLSKFNHTQQLRAKSYG